MLKGTALGTLLGLAIGVSFATIVLVLSLPVETPADWSSPLKASAIAVLGGVFVGMIAGVASSAPEHGLPLPRSMIVVALSGIVAIFFAPNPKFNDWFFFVPVGGVIVGGVIVALLGMERTRSGPGPSTEDNRDGEA